MNYIRSNSFKLKSLFSLRRKSFDGDIIPSPSSSSSIEEDKSFNIIHPTTTTTKSCHNKLTWRCFSYEEIFIATNGFSSENLVGKGGYAEVYRGVLENGLEIAVKRLTKASTDERKEKEFLTEIGTIGHVCHPNVLSLVGCCVDNGLHLIFPLSSRGSVASLLHDENLPAMEWKTRYKIAVGTINTNKATTLSKSFLIDYLITDLLCYHSLKPKLNKGKVEDLVDPRLGGTYDNDQLSRVAFAASLCIRTSPLWRPTMSEVLKGIEEGETGTERRMMPKGEDEPHEYLGFEDLEYECDSSFSISPRDSVSIGSS